MIHIKRDGAVWCKSKVWKGDTFISLSDTKRIRMVKLCDKCQEKLDNYYKNNLIVVYENGSVHHKSL